MTQTTRFLKQWHSGDERALETLIERHLPWIRDHVRQRMGPLLRKKGETFDYVQEAMVQFLQYGPRFLVSSDEQFRCLLLKVVENTLRNQHDRFVAKRREIARERPISNDTVLSLDAPRRRAKTPSKSAERHEREAWIRMGMEFLESEEREIILLRKWENLSFPEIGKRLKISKDAARMRHNRVILKLAERVGALRRGELPLIEED